MGLKLITGSTGTAHVASADDRARFASTFGATSCVLDIGEGTLRATVVDNNNITLGAGDIIIQGTHARIAYADTAALTIASGTLGYNRIDSIVAQYTLSNGVESMTLAVVQGTASASTPSAPTLTTGNILEGATSHQEEIYRVTLSGISISTCVLMLPVVSATLATLAANYSASSTYALGAICSRSGKIYRCTTAITTAEAWTASHWTATTLGTLITELLQNTTVPTHASTHGANGADAVTPSAIGAAGLDSNLRVLPVQLTSMLTTLTSSFTLATTHAGRTLLVGGSSDVTVTIPTYASVAIVNMTEIEIVRYGTGAVTIAAASGVTLLSLDSAVSISGQYGVVALKKLDTNTWLLAGALS